MCMLQNGGFLEFLITQITQAEGHRVQIEFLGNPSSVTKGEMSQHVSPSTTQDLLNFNYMKRQSINTNITSNLSMIEMLNPHLDNPHLKSG
jgi:hypothetical protein